MKMNVEFKSMLNLFNQMNDGHRCFYETVHTNFISDSWIMKLKIADFSSFSTDEKQIVKCSLSRTKSHHKTETY